MVALVEELVDVKVALEEIVEAGDALVEERTLVSIDPVVMAFT